MYRQYTHTYMDLCKKEEKKNTCILKLCSQKTQDSPQQIVSTASMGENQNKISFHFHLNWWSCEHCLLTCVEMKIKCLSLSIRLVLSHVNLELHYLSTFIILVKFQLKQWSLLLREKYIFLSLSVYCKFEQIILSYLQVC